MVHLSRKAERLAAVGSDASADLAFRGLGSEVVVAAKIISKMRLFDLEHIVLNLTYPGLDFSPRPFSPPGAW